MPSKHSWRGDNSGSEDSDSDRPRRSEKKTSRKKKSSSKSRHRDSSDSDDSSSSSGSDSDDRKSKKRKKHKEKKAKKDKKSKKRSKAVDQNEFGKYGILRESDFHTKSVSFNVWLREIKKINDFNGPKWEAMELFKEYMEDYNTATFPHEKYYDVEKYEMRQLRKKAAKEGKRKGTTDAHEDEEAMRRERLRQRVEEGNKDFSLIMQTMSKEKIENMRNQEKLRTQMQLHYKSGNVTEARRLEVLLNKVDDKTTQFQ